MIAEVVFGKPASGVEITPTGLVVSIQLPVLHGNSSMVLADSDTLIARQSGVFHLLQNEDLLVGAACVSNTTPPQTAASLVYHDLLQAVKGFNLVRVWNYVPEINENNGALENYQSFCVGRAEQFSESKLSLPAASAVGVNGDKLIVHFHRHPAPGAVSGESRTNPSLPLPSSIRTQVSLVFQSQRRQTGEHCICIYLRHGLDQGSSKRPRGRSRKTVSYNTGQHPHHERGNHVPE